VLDGHNAPAKLARHHKAAQGDVKEQKRPPTEIGTAIMISEVQRVIVILVAMSAFLFAVSARTGLVLRGSPPTQCHGSICDRH
jgi:hypothetical protein